MKYNKIFALAVIVVSFPCVVSSDQINPDFQTPIQPSWNVQNARLSEIDLTERFKNACSNTKTHSPNLECPFLEKNVCRGEGCFEEGLIEVIRPFALFQSPYSSREISTVQNGEIFVFNQTLLFSVPCPGVVISSFASDHPKLDLENSIENGDTVHRLSYAGEGTYRYLVNGEVKSSAVGDTVEYVDGCVLREELWLLLRDSTDLVGWALANFESMNGLSVHNARLSRPMPEWVKGLISESRYSWYSE